MIANTLPIVCIAIIIAKITVVVVGIINYAGCRLAAIVTGIIMYELLSTVEIVAVVSVVVEALVVY